MFKKKSTGIITWDKKKMYWIIAKDAWRKIEAFAYCPKCKEDVCESNKDQLIYSDWVTMSKQDFQDFLNFTCRACYKQSKISDFEEIFQNFWLNRVFDDMKRIATHPIMAIMSKKGVKSGEVQLVYNFIKIALSGGESGIKIKCGNCKKANKFIIADEENQIIQCIGCGYYNKSPQTSQ